MPGRTLTRGNVPSFFQAPWWAPHSHKEDMYKRFCLSHPLISIQWLSDGQDQRLVVSNGPKVVFKKAGLIKAEILGDGIRTWAKKGKSEEHLSLWRA